MKPFRFRLERLFRLRSTEERERARALGHARRAEQTRKETLDEADGYLRRCSSQVAETTEETTPAGMLQNLDLAVRAAARQAKAAADEHRAAEEQVQAEEERFGRARQKRRVVERLRKRREEAWSQEASREEQRECDSQARLHRDWRGRQ